MLAGSIPTEVGQCTQLITLFLDANQLTGSWELVIVLIDGTSLLIDGNALADSIPTEIGQCSQLEKLELDNNKLAGSCDFVIVVIDGKRVYQLTDMRWQVRFQRKLGNALS